MPGLGGLTHEQLHNHVTAIVSTDRAYGKTAFVFVAYARGVSGSLPFCPPINCRDCFHRTAFGRGTSHFWIGHSGHSITFPSTLGLDGFYLAVIFGKIVISETRR